jgi:hypothetical protein
MRVLAAALLLGPALIFTPAARSSAATTTPARATIHGGKGNIWGTPAVVQCGHGDNATHAIFKGAVHGLGSFPGSGQLAEAAYTGESTTLELLVTGGTGLRVHWTLSGPGRLAIKGCTAVWSGTSTGTVMVDARAARDPHSNAGGRSPKLTALWTLATLTVYNGSGSGGGGSGGGGSTTTTTPASATISGDGNLWGTGAVVQCGSGDSGTYAIFEGATHSDSYPTATGVLNENVSAGQPVTVKLLVTGGTGLRVRWTFAGPGQLSITGCTAVWSGGDPGDEGWVDARAARDPNSVEEGAQLTSLWTIAALYVPLGNTGGGASGGGGGAGGGSGGGGGGSGGGCTVNYGYLSVSGFYDNFDVYLDGEFFGHASFFNAELPLGSHILSFYDYYGNFYKSVSIDVNPCDSWSFS